MDESSSSESASSSSSSSESSESYDAADSDVYMGSSDSSKLKRTQPKSKKMRSASDSSSEYMSAIDVESQFSFGVTLAPADFRREFKTDGNVESSVDAVISTEEVDKMCKNVPPYVAKFIRLYYELSTRFDFPSWYNPKNLRDKDKRAPSNPEYDVNSLYVPRKNGKVIEDGHSTPMLQQYWDIKEDHFSDIILFKVGKFYELFYIDAGIAQQVCQLKWMGHDRRAHVGFPETSLQHHAAMLIEQGYTVCVVEQTETVTEANERSANAGRKSTGALVERKICEVFTSGTLIHEEMMNTRSSQYLCSLAPNDSAPNFSVGLVLVDCATGLFQIGTFGSLATLKTVLYSFQPREILFDPKRVSPESELYKLLNASRESLGSVLTRWSADRVGSIVPERLKDSGVYSFVNSDKALTTAVSGVVGYLKHLLLEEQVVQCGDWKLLNASEKSGASMVMDSTVLAQLEILRDSEFSERGSLLKFVDRTCTHFGSRLIHRWICAPLADASQINERLDAVEWFSLSAKSVMRKLEEKLKQLPDLERRLQRICAMALQQQRNAVYFGEVENKRIGVFLSFLSSVETAIGSLEWLSHELPKENGPSLIAQLCSHEGIADELKLVSNNLKGMIETKKDGSFCPRKGAFEDYDRITDQLKELDSAFKDELANIKDSLKIKHSGEAIFVSIKFRNEVEVPVEYESRVKNWSEASPEITSCRKGYVRFQTERIRELVQKTEDLEQQQKDLLYPFMAKLFGVVNEKKFLIGTLIQRIAQLDCLMSLGKLAAQGGKTWTRPKVGSEYDSPLSIKLVNSRHPIQEHLMQLEREFVPNTLLLGRDVGENIVIVTGANMGGKSTILRQACINVILAQMGCFVPAEECEISAPVDRIFTRIGASDNILEGKSTFLTELEETAVMLREASSRSLLVIDELGRGTSTYDGVAIAGATLSSIAKIGCICLFATHYHKLCEDENVDEIRKSGGQSCSVGLYHMECITQESGSIELTHKFRQGLYPHSQAMHVAKLAGLPEAILIEAEDVSKRFLRNQLIA
jgi:DNA mismatch repair protein MSH6